MGTKAEETAEGAEGCLASAADDEPLFILRAKDILAPGIIRVWAGRAHARGTPPAKVGEALELANKMEAWQEENDGGKVPD